MFTLFHALQLAGLLCGLGLGCRIGYQHLGALGGALGAVVGSITGFAVGRIPLLLSLRWVFGQLHREPAERLRERLRGEEYFISHLLLAELMSRGEEIDSELGVILELLRSDSFDRRRFGWGSLQLAFPQFADRIADYDPSDPTELCRSKVDRLDGAV